MHDDVGDLRNEDDISVAGVIYDHQLGEWMLDLNITPELVPAAVAHLYTLIDALEDFERSGRAAAQRTVN